MVDAVIEKLGPAERIINAILAYSDHMVHNRPGVVVPDPTSVTGVKWSPVTHKVEEGQKVVYRLDKVGKKTNKVRIGVMHDPTEMAFRHDVLDIMENGRKVGIYRPAGLFPEVAAWMYRQVAAVWTLDNEFAARWASFAFGQEHRDLKVVLAAFMLCQSRKGDPVLGDDGKAAFFDDDFRDIGEAMMLLDRKDGRHLDAKLLLRIQSFLALPEIAAVNRELGFSKSARHPFYGRWNRVVEKWLLYREENPKMLEGLVKNGFRTSVMTLARQVHYKPTSLKFFATLRWKQIQAEDGHRELAIGAAVAAAETWEGLTEEQVCERIIKDKPNMKRIVGLLPTGMTRAIMAAAIEAGSLSSKDLIISTPTLEELGLLEVQPIREKWEKAIKAAEDMRAANIALRVKSKEVKDKLDEGADNALKKAVEEVITAIRIYLMVDTSTSMEGVFEVVKNVLERFVQGIPLDHLHVAVFTTTGREIKIAHPSRAGIENAFRGVTVGGGTDYGAGIRALQQYKFIGVDEDNVFLFVGDEGHQAPHFVQAVEASLLKPVAFGLVPFASARYGRGSAVRDTAARLGIPCFEIDERTFADPYAIPRTLRALIASTPVGVRPAKNAPARLSLVETILKTDLLKKPAWAA